jgi:hypothetical protein
MACQNLEKVECIGNWLRAGLIIPWSEGGMGLPRDATPEEEDLALDPALADDAESTEGDVGSQCPHSTNFYTTHGYPLLYSVVEIVQTT